MPTHIEKQTKRIQYVFKIEAGGRLGEAQAPQKARTETDPAPERKAAISVAPFLAILMPKWAQNGGPFFPLKRFLTAQTCQKESLEKGPVFGPVSVPVLA